MMKRRIATMGLALCMVLSLLPVSVRAAEGDGDTPRVPAGTTDIERGQSLQELINDGDGLIQLNADVVYDAVQNRYNASLVVPAGREVTIDLNDHNIILQEIATEGVPNVIRVLGTLTVKDSTVAGSPQVSGDHTAVTYASGSIDCQSRGNGVLVSNKGTFTLSSGTVKSKNNGVVVFGDRYSDAIVIGPNPNAADSRANIEGGYVEAQEFAAVVEGRGAKLYVNSGVLLSKDNATVGGNGTNREGRFCGDTHTCISGGTLISNIQTPGYIACGVYHPQSGNLEINGGKIYANNGVGIVMRGGTLQMTRGEITATKTGDTVGKVGDSDVDITAGAPIVVDQSSEYYDYKTIRKNVVKILLSNAVAERYSPTFQLASGVKLETASNNEKTYYLIKTPYTITFNANDGAATAPFATLVTDADGKLASLPKPDPVRTDYAFMGWYLSRTGGTQVTTDTAFGNNTTVYAIWKENSGTAPAAHTVTFYLDESDTTQSYETKTTKDDNTIDWPEDPKKEGYVFKGWADAENSPYQKGDKFFADTELFACWEEETVSDIPAKAYTITLDANGGTLSGAGTVTTNDDGKLDTMPDNPAREGYTFNGWFTAADGGEKVDLQSTFTQDSTIYAQWTKDTEPPADGRYRIYGPGYVTGGRVDISHSTAEPGARVTIELRPWSDYDLDWLTVTNLDTGRRVSVNERYSDEYTFIMPSSDVEVEVSYTDRYYNRYYAGTYYAEEETPVDSGPVKWYYSGGSIYHVDSGLVPSGSPLTRDMLISVLYNMDPASSGDPTIWAGSKGIIPDIYMSVLWGVDKPISREQTATILYGYSRHMGYNTSQSTSLAGYADYRQISAAARPAMSWAKAAGLISGTSASTLSPQAILTSGQAGAILSRYVANVSRTW